MKSCTCSHPQKEQPLQNIIDYWHEIMHLQSPSKSATITEPY